MPSVSLETRPSLILLLALLIIPLSLPTTLSAKRVILATWLSVLLFVAFVICAWVRHAQGVLELSPMWVRKSGIWEGICKSSYDRFCTIIKKFDSRISICFRVTHYSPSIRLSERIPPTHPTILLNDQNTQAIFLPYPLPPLYSDILPPFTPSRILLCVPQPTRKFPSDGANK